MQADSLSATFTALADPTRRAILARLAQGEASVGELAAPFSMSLPAISRHLKVLERAALITREKDAQWRRCRLRAEGFRSAAGWLAEYERFWTGSLERLDRFLEEEAAAHDRDPPDDSPAHDHAEEADPDDHERARNEDPRDAGG